MSNIQAITYEGAKAVTKSDTAADPIGPFAGFLVTATGNVKFQTILGDTVTLSSLAANVFVPIACSRIWSTGTTATVLGLISAPYKGNPGGLT
jgi:hypothetical protein